MARSKRTLDNYIDIIFKAFKQLTIFEKSFIIET